MRLALVLAYLRHPSTLYILALFLAVVCFTNDTLVQLEWPALLAIELMSDVLGFELGGIPTFFLFLALSALEFVLLAFCIQYLVRTRLSPMWKSHVEPAVVRLANTARRRPR